MSPILDSPVMPHRPSSVVKTDQEALRRLLAIHAVAQPRILDVTHNRGRMWAGLEFRPHRLDSNPALHAEGFTDTVADFRALPFAPWSWDVIVFDPPHISEAGRTGLVGERRGDNWALHYGTLSDGFGGASISWCFPLFLNEAARVLAIGGVILAKISDQVHRAAYQWQHIDFILAGREAGFTACDLIVKIAKSRAGLIDPRWRNVWHVRKVHTFWIVLRNSKECHA